MRTLILTGPSRPTAVGVIRTPSGQANKETDSMAQDSRRWGTFANSEMCLAPVGLTGHMGKSAVNCITCFDRK